MVEALSISTILLIFSIVFTLSLTSCSEKTIIDHSKTMELKSQLEQNSNIEPNRSIATENKLISANGTENFTLNNTVQEIESKSGIRLNLSEATDECYTEDSNSDFQLLFLKDVLISISFFDSSYQTSKGFKVNDKISKLLRTHPEVEYHESTNNMGDESYYITTKYYTTQPNDQGNAFTFYVSGSDPDTISVIEVTNYSDDHSPCNAY